MAERRVTADGRILERGADGVIRVVGGGVTLPAPAKAQYEGPQAAANLGKTEEEIRQMRIKNRLDAEKLALDRERLAFDQGGGAPGAEERQLARKAWAAANELSTVLPKVETAFNEGPGKTRGPRGMLDFLPTEDNQNFDRAANRLRAPLKSVLGFQGGDTNAASESQVNVGPFVPSSWDFDKTNRGTFEALKDKRASSRNRAVMVLGGVPDSNGRVTPLPKGYRMGEFPDLDEAIATRIDRIPLKGRQEFIKDARRRYLAIRQRNTRDEDALIEKYLR